MKDIRHEMNRIVKKLELIMAKEMLKIVEKDFNKLITNAEEELKKLCTSKEKEILQG